MKNYPANWSQIAERIKRKNGYRCEKCGHKDDRDNGFLLGVHHLDRNPGNNEGYNLASLCQRCHLRLEGYAIRLEKRGTNIFEDSWDAYFAGLGIWPEHSKWFKPHWEGYLRSKNA